MATIRTGLVGVTGYTGMELARLLAGHDGFELVRATSRSDAGRRLYDIWPALRGFAVGDVTLTEPDADDLAAACDLVFLAVPHGTAMTMARALRDRNVKVVDLSADFRLRDPEIYEDWYQEHTQRELLQEAVFGLPELYEDAVRRAGLVANPGCYPTGTILGLTPALRTGMIDTDGIVIDAKSGTSGAGRSAKVGSLYCEVADSFKAYGLASHRHTPEIEQELSVAAGRDVRVSFNPHLVPMNRGILCTVYTRLAGDEMPTAEDCVRLWRDFYAGKPWVRILDAGRLPETRHVRGTMFCDIGLVCDPRTRRLIIVTAIDNLCRGASGQALANANIMSGFPLAKGLGGAPLL